MVIFPKKKKKELKSFKYPHTFEIGDLVAVKKGSTKILLSKRDLLATIVDIKIENGVEKIVLYWQDGQTQEWSLPSLVLYFERL